MGKLLKIIYAGTPDFAILPLQALLRNKKFNVGMVVTQIDRKAGRKRILMSPPVKKFALLNKLVVRQPLKIKEIAREIEFFRPDFTVVVSYGQIFPKEILEIPRFGCLNIHFSLLPKYRGASPVQETLLRSDKKTGISIILMNEKLDEGDILLQKKIAIKNDDTSQILLEKLSHLAGKLLPNFLIKFSEGKIRPKKQSKKGISYCRKISKEDGLIDFKKEEALQILNKIRAYNKWPGTFFPLKGKMIKIYSAEYAEQKNSSNAGIPAGKIVWINKRKIGIGTKKGVIYPKIVQLEGRKIMRIEEFLNGYRSLFS